VSAAEELGSPVCRFEHFLTPWYRTWNELFDPPGSNWFDGFLESAIWPPEARAGVHLPIYHRKMWEWCVVAETLERRGLLAPGKRGLGFAVGTEPLASLFAARGVTTHATDIAENLAGNWSGAGQHAAGLDDLYKSHIVDRTTFDTHVTLSPADMRAQWSFPERSYDFVWSCCALEHLGSLNAGVDFLVRAARLLRPGGVGVHTTEYNVVSDNATFETTSEVIYRRRDIEEIDRILRREGRCLEQPDFRAGSHRYDREYDVPPYYHTPERQHVKLALGGFVSTSILLTVVA
jgi:SAM-dependent methyltransferase